VEATPEQETNKKSTHRNAPDPEPPPQIIRAINHITSTLTYASMTAIRSGKDDSNLKDMNTLQLTEKVDHSDTSSVADNEEVHNIEQQSLINTCAIQSKHTLQAPKMHNRITSIRLMQSAATHAFPIQNTIKLHIDGGANRSITNDINLLINYKNIKTYRMSSAGGENDIACTGVGYLPWRSDTGETILIKCYFSQNAPETIISPSDIVMNHMSTYHAWTQHADLTTNKGHITFINNDTEHTTVFPLINRNGLWYYINNNVSDYNSIGIQALIPTMRRINNATMYELVHARLGHPGTRVMTTLHKHVDGIPKLTIPPLYRCGTCVLVNATKRAITHQEVTRIHTYTKNMEGVAHTENTENNTSADHTEAKHEDSVQPGQ
jgi:hypothetical protein